jgi:hypothetical protein
VDSLFRIGATGGVDSSISLLSSSLEKYITTLILSTGAPKRLDRIYWRTPRGHVPSNAERKDDTSKTTTHLARPLDQDSLSSSSVPPDSANLRRYPQDTSVVTLRRDVRDIFPGLTHDDSPSSSSPSSSTGAPLTTPWSPSPPQLSPEELQRIKEKEEKV